MAASAHLSGIQFKYKELPDMHSIQAVHPAAGVVGSMHWVKPESADDFLMEPGEVHSIAVHKDFQRQGVGTALWNAAKETGTPLAHSYVRSDSGRAWSSAVGD